LVVDGSLGFAGGTNIRVGHWLALNPRAPVRCLHFQVSGPVVAQFQEAFAVDWAFTTGEALQGQAWFPTLKPTGSVWARGIADGPDEEFERFSHTLLGALAVAQRRVVVATPYFLPLNPLIQALIVAALRGISVDIVMPETNNWPIVQWASMTSAWELLENGCRLHFSHGPFDHTKLMVVDRCWSLFGSSNWDPRSLRLNFEFNVEGYDRPLAETLDGLIQSKINCSRQLTMDDVRRRSLPVQLRDGLSRLLTPYM
jgi:cardiolipin synthase